MRRRYLFENEELKNTKILFIYAGGFQPFGFHHKQVYNKILTLPVDSNVVISTAGAKFGDPQESAKKAKSAKRDYFNFTDKEKIMHDLFGINKNLILNIKNNYRMEDSIQEYLINNKILNNNDVILVWVVGQKDSSRALPHLPIITLSELESNKNNLKNRVVLKNDQLEFDIQNLGYMLILPNITGSDEQILSASAFRNLIQDQNISLEKKIDGFQNYFNKPFDKSNQTHVMIFKNLLDLSSNQIENYFDSLNESNKNEYLKILIKNRLLNEIKRWY